MKKEEKQLTIKELIELLKCFPEDMPVMSEGCDCYGICGDVTTIKYDDKDQLLILRSN